MGNLEGESTAEITAPIETVWELVADVERAPDWQGGLKALSAVERDEQGRAVVCESENDAKVKTIHSTVRFEYEAPTKLTWEQVHGELKSVTGHWLLEDLGDGRTQATYRVDVDFGFTLGMLIRGPLVGVLRSQLAGARAGELKKAIESGG